MITNNRIRQVETGGQPIKSAKYVIAPGAEAHISAILRNLYSDPVRAVLREYMSNAVDAHVEAKQTAPIKVHLPTIMEPWLIVRDFASGLDVPSTETLLYGYGASGELKRVSNDQIGGFGIGCKCGFAIADAFTYTIWHGGMRRVWSCFLDDRDEGQAVLVSEEASSDPTGIEVKIPFAMERYSAVLEVQRALNYLLPFMPGNFEFDTSQYTIPDKAVATIEQDAVCRINDVDYNVRYQFYPSGKFEMPALVVGGTHYKIEEGQLDDVTEFKNAGSTKAQNRLRELKTRLVIQAPIGFVQLAPSREQLQYSGHTKKVLKQLFTTFASAAFQDALMASVKSKYSAHNILTRRIQSQILGIPLWEAQSTENGLIIPPGCTEGIKTVIYRGVSYSCARATDTVEYDKDVAAKQEVSTGSSWVDEVDSRHRRMVLVDLDKWPSDVHARELARRAVTKVHKETANVERVLTILTVNVDKVKVKWIADGSVPCLTEADLPVEDTSIFAISYTRSRSRTRTPPAANLGTKFLKLRVNPRDNHNGDGRWWDPAPVKDTKGAIYVVVDKYRAATPGAGNYTVDPSDLHSAMPYLRKVLPNLADLHAVRCNDPKRGELANRPEFAILWQALHDKFKADIKSGALDAEVLLTTLCVMDWSGSRSRHNTVAQHLAAVPTDALSNIYNDVLTHPGMANSAVAKTVKAWYTTFRKGQKGLVADWVCVISELAEVLRVYGGDGMNFQLGTVLQKKLDATQQLFPFDDATGPLATWWKGRTDPNWVRLEGLLKRVPRNPIEEVVAQVCEDLPILTHAYELPELWDNYEYPNTQKRAALKLTRKEEVTYCPQDLDAVIKALAKSDPRFQTYLNP